MRSIVWVVLSGFLLGSGSVRGEEPPVAVAAYYYSWYGADGRHWREGYQGKAEGITPAAGLYDSRDPEVIRRQLDLSRECGINHWIVSWWGPGSWEEETLRRYVLPELERHNAEHPGQPVTFSLFYEAGGLLGLDPERGIEFDSGRINTFVSHFRHLAATFLDHPACRKIEGRPVVGLYLSRTFSGDFVRALAGARAAVEARGHRVFLVGDEVYWHDPDPDRLRLYDAVTPYNLHGPPQYAGAGGRERFLRDAEDLQRRWREAALAAGVGYLPGFMPGFDSSGVAPGAHYPIPRTGSAGTPPESTLAAMAESAKRLVDPRLNEVVLTSFNEWHEGTQVEPSGAGENGGEILRKVFRGR